MTAKCKETVSRDGWFHRQCSRKVWKDEYCKQHHPDTVAARRKVAKINNLRKLKESPLAKAHAEIDRLKAENELLKARLGELTNTILSHSKEQMENGMRDNTR